MVFDVSMDVLLLEIVVAIVMLGFIVVDLVMMGKDVEMVLVGEILVLVGKFNVLFW